MHGVWVAATLAITPGSGSALALSRSRDGVSWDPAVIVGPRSGELAWALRRFELGCERDSRYEALTDHLLALRALLEPEGPESGLKVGCSH